MVTQPTRWQSKMRDRMLNVQQILDLLANAIDLEDRDLTLKILDGLMRTLELIHDSALRD